MVRDKDRAACGSKVTLEMTSRTGLNKPEIAVLLAVYNGMQWLPEQLESIRNQQGVRVSIFASVDVSTDGTEAWLANYAETYPDLKLLPPGVFGGAAKNFFRLLRDVDLAPFDYVAFADQDDVWHLDKLYAGHSIISRGTAQAYSANVSAFWPDGRSCLINKAFPQRRYDYLFEAAGPGCTYMLSRPVAQGLKSFLEAHWQAINNVALHDWFIYAWTRAAGWTWFIDPRPVLRYRQHAQNQVGANKGWHALRKRLQLVRAGWYRAEIDRIHQLVSPLLARQGPFGEKKLPSRWVLLANIRHLRRSAKDRAFLFALLLFNLY